MPSEMFSELRRKERSLCFGRRTSIFSPKHLRNRRFAIFCLKSLSSWISSKCHTFQMCFIHLDSRPLVSRILLNHLFQQYIQNYLPQQAQSSPVWFGLPQHTHVHTMPWWTLYSNWKFCREREWHRKILSSAEYHKQQIKRCLQI